MENGTGEQMDENSQKKTINDVYRSGTGETE